MTRQPAVPVQEGNKEAPVRHGVRSANSGAARGTTEDDPASPVCVLSCLVLFAFLFPLVFFLFVFLFLFFFFFFFFVCYGLRRWQPQGMAGVEQPRRRRCKDGAQSGDGAQLEGRAGTTIGDGRRSRAHKVTD